MKKSILFLLLFVAMSAIGQQISELQKGLIFRWEGSEWNPYRDMVSGTLGTATATYNTQDRQGNGGTRNVQYNGTSSVSSFAAIAAFGTSDFMVTAKIQVGELGAVRTIIGGAAHAFNLNISATGYLTADTTGGSALTASTTLLAASTVYKVSYSRSGTTGTYYVNGIAAGTCTDSNNYSVGCTLVGNGTGYFNGSIFMVRAFNWAASVANYSKPEYPIEASDRDGAGNLCVLDLNAEGLSQSTSGYWYDRTNTLTATNSGTTVVVPPASNLSATYFNGTTSKVVVPVTGITLGATPRTITAKILMLTNSGNPMIVSYGTDNSHTTNYLFVSSATNKMSFGDGTNPSAQSTTSLNTNTWYNIAITYGSGIINYYLNGVLDGTATITGTTNTPNSSIYIGVFVDGTSYKFNGLMEDVNIYQEVLDADRIKLINDTNF